MLVAMVIFSSVPTGFKALCSGNVPVADEVDPAQTDDNFPQKLFNPLLYVGNSTDDRNVTGVGFAPDWVWIKDRDVSEGHQIYDSNRGAEKEYNQMVMVQKILQVMYFKLFKLMVFN